MWGVQCLCIWARGILAYLTIAESRKKRLSAKHPFRCKIKWCFSASLTHSFKNNSNFAFADRFANHTSWVRFAEPSPVWGCAERDVVEIHKKAFIRADSWPSEMSRKLFFYLSQGLSNGRCPWICDYLASGMVFREKYGRRHWLHILAWASAVAVWLR